MQNFNYHTHTYRCGHADSDMSDEDYVKEYLKIGLKQFAFTDHCPEKNNNDKRENVRMDYSQKEEYKNSIKTLKEKYKDKIDILFGYEIEYLPDEEENLKELRDEADRIVLGQHFIYDDNGNLKTTAENLSEKELIRLANYIENATKIGLPDVIAHPDVFMYSKENFRKAEERVAHMICKTAEKYQIPLEINLNNVFANTYYEGRKLNNLPVEVQREKISKVKYPCREFWNIAKDYNIKVVYGIDAHHRGQILLWDNLIKLTNEVIGLDIIEKLNFVEG